MKRTLCMILAALLALSLIGCGKARHAPAPESGGEAQTGGVTDGAGSAAGTPAAPRPAGGKYRRVDITPDNWTQYFELREIPLYTVTQGEVIAQVCQNYCVLLREEYLPYLKPEGDYRVRFELQFDLYIDTLDVDTNERVYRHTDDLFYAVQATKPATFDRAALTASAYGGDARDYEGYANAFFIGYATLHPDYKIWAGFYVDLGQVQLQSVSGYLELAE